MLNLRQILRFVCGILFLYLHRATKIKVCNLYDAFLLFTFGRLGKQQSPHSQVWSHGPGMGQAQTCCCWLPLLLAGCFLQCRAKPCTQHGASHPLIRWWGKYKSGSRHLASGMLFQNWKSVDSKVACICKRLPHKSTVCYLADPQFQSWDP